MDSCYQLTENQKAPLWWFHLVWACFSPEQFPQIQSKMTKFIWSCGHCRVFITFHHMTTWIRRNKACSSGVFWWVLSGQWVKISEGFKMYSIHCLVSIIISAMSSSTFPVRSPWRYRAQIAITVLFRKALWSKLNTENEGKWSIHALRAKTLSGPKHVLAPFICSSCSLFV